MNEEGLKKIWNSGNTNKLPEINFIQFQKKIENVEDKLRKKIKKDIFGNLVIYISLIPFSYFFPRILYFVPLFILIWVWYLRQVLRIYKTKNAVNDINTTKEFLTVKKSRLLKYLRNSRIIGYLIVPVLVVLCMLLQISIYELLDRWIVVLSIIIVLEIICIAVVEISFRIMYMPVIKDLNGLLDQLEFEN